MPAPLEKPWSVIAAQAAGGMTLEALAEHHDVSIGTLKARSARENWKLTARETAATKAGSLPAHPQSGSMQPRATEQALDVLGKLGEGSKLDVAKGLRKGSATVAAMDGQSVLEQAQAIQAHTKSLAAIHGWDKASNQSSPLLLLSISGCPSVTVQEGPAPTE